MRRLQILDALSSGNAPMTARQVGEQLGIGKHEARRLLNLLLEGGHVGWRPDGWITVT